VNSSKVAALAAYKAHHGEPPPNVNGGTVDTVDTVDTVSKKLPDAKPFPGEAMPEHCRPLIREAAAAIGCPPEFVALPMLVILGSAIGNSRTIKLKQGWEESSAIFAAVVAAPGEKKTPAQKVAIDPAIKAQAALKEEYRQAKETYEEQVRHYEVEKREARNAGEAADAPPTPPVIGRTVVEDTTVEALAEVLGENPRGIAVVKDELAGWKRAMDQYKAGGKGNDRQFWLSAWSNSYVSVDRKSREEPLILPNPFAGLLGSIQPGVLPELSDNREDGLLDRILFTYPEPLPSRWSEEIITPEAVHKYRDLYNALRGLHIDEDDHGEPVPNPLELSEDAKALLVANINKLRQEMEEPWFPGRLKGPWSKLEAYFARLCLILALARTAGQKVGEQVEADDVGNAKYLLDYFRNHARRVTSRLHERDSLEVLAEDLATFLTLNGGRFKDEVSVLYEQLDSKHKGPRPDELTKKLKTLARRYPERIGFKDGQSRKDGKPRRYVEIFLGNGVDGVDGVDRGDSR